MRAKITVTVVLLICLASPAATWAQQTNASGLENWETLERVRVGQETVVKLKDGSKIKGRKVFADASKLTLYSGEKTKAINRDQVAQVFIMVAYESRKESAVSGAAGGAMFGALLGALAPADKGKHALNIGAFFAVIGAAMGALAPEEDYKKMLIYEAKK